MYILQNDALVMSAMSPMSAITCVLFMFSPLSIDKMLYPVPNIYLNTVLETDKIMPPFITIITYHIMAINSNSR